MNIPKHTIRTTLAALFSYSRLQLAIMLALSIFILIANFQAFSIIDDTKEKLLLHFIVSSILTSMFAAHFAVPMIHLSRHHLWRIDQVYRKQLTASLILILSFIIIALDLIVSSNVQEFLILLLSNAGIAMLILQVHFAFRVFEKLVIIPTLLIIVVAAHAGQFGLSAAIILFIVSALLLYKSWSESKHRERKLTAMIVDIWDFSSNSQAWSKMGLQNWVVRNLGKNIQWNQKDLKWGINLPLNQFGFMPILFFSIVLTMSFGKNTGDVSDFLIIVYTLSISISLPLESSSLLKQLRPVFHLYPGKKELTSAIIKTIDKVILKQSSLFLIFIAIAALLFKWELDYRYTMTATIATFTLNWGLYPLLLGLNIKKVTFRGLVFGLAYMGVVWAIIYTLHFAGNLGTTLLMFSGYQLAFLLLRILSIRSVYARDIEQLTAGSCLGAIK